jgi:hypothetical protein
MNSGILRILSDRAPEPPIELSLSHHLQPSSARLEVHVTDPTSDQAEMVSTRLRFTDRARSGETAKPSESALLVHRLSRMRSISAGDAY